MKRSTATAAIALTFIVASMQAAPAKSQAAGAGNGARFIVVLHDGVDALEAMTDLLNTHGGSADHIYQNSIKGFAGPLGAGRAAAIAEDPRVKYVEADGVASISGALVRLAPMAAPAVQTVPNGVQRIDADQNATAKIDGVDQRVNVDVAVIDTGIQRSHPDLNVLTGVTVTGAGKSGGEDDNGHGTHVAGTIGALDNGFGVVGVAPGARLWAVKVLNKQGSGTWSGVVAGMDWVTARSGQIEAANMSLGGGYSQGVNDAVARMTAAGIVLSVAAGNEAVDAGTTSPASAPSAITVSAIADYNGVAGGGAAATTNYGADDTFATFSNFGSVVDIAAPGVAILSTVKGSTYATYSGTSMATPHVTGVVALYLATHTKPTDLAGVLSVRDALVTAANVRLSSGETPSYGFTGDPDSSPEPLLTATGW